LRAGGVLHRAAAVPNIGLRSTNPSAQLSFSAVCGKFDMERFEGRQDLAFVAGLTGALLLAGMVFVISQAWPQLGTFTITQAVAGLFGMGGFGAAAVFLLWVAREMSASYEVDDRAIIRHAWGRSVVLPWCDLESVEEQSPIESKTNANAFARTVLQSGDGGRLAIRSHFLADGARLRARLEPQLAPLRDLDLLEIAKHGRSFRPTRTVGILVLTCMFPMFLIAGLSGVDLSGSGGFESDRALWYIGLIGIAASPLLVILALELISRELTISHEGVALRSLFLKRTIPFAHLESIDVEAIESTDEPGVERAKIRGTDGQSITLDSSMPGYRPALELARKHVAAKISRGVLDDPEFA
jgi:hypothetical protein